jgi:hypothetical protein
MADWDRPSASTASADNRGEWRQAQADATSGSLLRAVNVFVHEYATLFALEGRLAVLSLIIMLAAGIFAALLLTSVWLFVLAAIVVRLVRSGWPWEGVLLGIAVVNTVIAFICWAVIRRLSRNLLFTATRRVLRPVGTPAKYV